jgi:PTH1 family peptidyl-tRNA hydrolase
MAAFKVICGLGNPGPEYENTRHNVGWWLLDAIQTEWRFPNFRRAGRVLATEGRLEDQTVHLVKPLTFMNRSGSALAPLRDNSDFVIGSDLLVVSDDVALPVGKARIRAMGSAGGHNGLKSIEAVLRTQEYPRLRIGVGAVPTGEDMADWVLSSFEKEDEQPVRDLIPKLIEVARAWVTGGVQPASQRMTQP